MNSLTNKNLKSNSLYPFIQRRIFSEDECNKILQTPTVKSDFKTKGHDSYVNFIVEDDSNSWIRNKIDKEVIRINKRVYKFKDIYLRDEIGIRTYDVGHKYDWHTDNFLHQRLTLTVQLNTDYDGGDLFLFNGDFAEPKKQIGVITIFPSYLFHTSTPVTRGSKKIIITHVLGPKHEWYENEKDSLDRMRVDR